MALFYHISFKMMIKYIGAYLFTFQMHGGDEVLLNVSKNLTVIFSTISFGLDVKYKTFSTSTKIPISMPISIPIIRQETNVMKNGMRSISVNKNFKLLHCFWFIGCFRIGVKNPGAIPLINVPETISDNMVREILCF